MKSVSLLALGVLVYAITVNAWICDDAYITFRSVDNLAAGLGPVWNTVNRVQAFTHPLWLLMLTPLYLLTGEIYFTAIIVSLLLSTAAALVIQRRVSRALGWQAAIVFLLLSGSRAFVDYSTSGLETPLLFLLLALFCVQFIPGDDSQQTGPAIPRAGDSRGENQQPLLIALLLTSLLFTTRPDSVLLTIPAVAHLAYRASGRPWRRLATTITVGLSPAIAWEFFSLFYYGFPLPNTAYAKLDTGIARLALAQQAGWYYLNSLRWDPLTLSTIAAGLLTSIFGDVRQRLMAAGVALFLLYLFYIGGDFMSGRFFAAPLLISTLLLCLQLKNRPSLWLTAASALVLIAIAPSPTLLPPGERNLGMDHGIADERGVYFGDTGLIHYRRNEPYPSHPYFKAGRRFRDSRHPAALNRYVGFFGFAAGPDRVVVDPMGLSDPLLSRLPVSDPHRWRIGHFERTLPEGFLESVGSGDNLIKDPDLRSYYGHLRSIARGPLWSAHRIREIALFNLGHYDGLLDAYLGR